MPKVLVHYLKGASMEVPNATVEVRDPEFGVEVCLSEDGSRLWVNLDGVCILRIQGMKRFDLSVPVPLTVRR